MQSSSPTCSERPAARRAALAAAMFFGAATGLAGQDAIALAVSPLPEAEQSGARVIQDQGGEWVTLREGSGTFVCIADAPGDERFQASCYHSSLEPYMARGRELRGGGMSGGESLAKRVEEISAGTLEMPDYALLHSIFAPPGWTGDMSTANRLTVIYTPFANAGDIGLPTSRSDGPWMMASGQANAHIMIPR